MMKIYLFILLTLISTVGLSQDRYVSVSGSGDHSGTSPFNEWTWQEAISQAAAGNIVHVRAGNYGRVLVVQTNNGTATNPIIFQGYKNTPGDITPTSKTFTHKGQTYTYTSSFSRGDAVDASEMPLFDGGNGSLNGISANIQGDYVTVKNIQFTRYRHALNFSGSHQTAENLYVLENGNLTASHNYVDGGFGIRFNGSTNATARYCYTRDNGSENLTMATGTGNLITHCFAESSGHYSNPSDYYLSFAGDVTNSRIEYATVYRDPSNSHGGHGIDFKRNVQNSTIQYCHVINTYIENIGTGVKNNVISDCSITSAFKDGGSPYGNLFIASGANNNTYKNIRLKDDFSPIRMVIYEDNSLGAYQGWTVHDNVFRNIVVTNSTHVVGFYETANSTDPNGIHNNTFDGISAFDCTSFVRQNQPNSNNIFKNISLHNVPDFVGGNQSVLNTNTIFDNINLSGNSFSISEFTSYNESNITEIDVIFEEWKPTSSALNRGEVSEDNPTDILGIIRTAPITLGAFEFDGNDQCTTESIIPEYQLDGVWQSGENNLTVDEGTQIVLSMLPNTIALQSLELPDGTIVGDNYNLGNVTPANNGSYILTSVEGCQTTIELNVVPSCPIELINTDESITIERSFWPWPGDYTLEGINDNTINTCTLKVGKNSNGNTYIRYMMEIILVNNNLFPGDQLEFAISGNGANGNAKVIVASDYNLSNRLVDHSFGNGASWTTLQENITIPDDTEKIYIALYPNAGNSQAGYSLYGNLSIKKIDQCTDESIIPEYQLDGVWQSGENNLTVDEGTQVVLSMLPNTITLQSIELPDGTLVGDNYNLGLVTPDDNGLYTLTSIEGCITTIELTVSSQPNTNSGEYFTTESQRVEVKNRLDSGWSDPDGDFPNVVARLNSRAASFLTNPTASRFTNTDPHSFYREGADFTSEEIQNGAQFFYAPQENWVTAILYPFDAAKIGWAQKDPQYANTLFMELLWLAQNPDLDFSNEIRFPRDKHPDSFPYSLIGNYVRQWVTWYKDYISIYEDISTEAQRNLINTWFRGAGNWAYDLVNSSTKGIGLSLGVNWQFVTDDAYEFSVGWSNTKPSQLYNSSGVQLTEFTTTDQAAFIGNNRFWGLVGLCHVEAIYSMDMEKRDMIVQMFKNYFKWSIFPNGIPMEIDRNSYPHNPNHFFGYFHEILQGLSEVAYREQVIFDNGYITSNGWQWESLFEYTTTLGGVNGEVIGNGRVWNGGNTTDGVTEKGLKLFIEAGIKFLEDSFDFYTSTGLKINTTEKRFPSAYGIANTYYNNPRIRSAEYMINTDGMPGGAPTTPANMPTLSGVFGSVNFPIGYIGMGGKVFSNSPETNPCPDKLINDSVDQNPITFLDPKWHFTPSQPEYYFEGVSDPQTNNSECALKIGQTDSAPSQGKNLRIPIDLEANNINSGDRIEITLDANGDNGNPRIVVIADSDWNTYLANEMFPTNSGWESIAVQFDIPEGADQIFIRLYSNMGSYDSGYSIYDNLVVRKVEVNNCTNTLNNEDSSVSLSAASNAAGLDNVAGTHGNGSETCGIKIENNDESQPWARLRIPIDLVANGISEGDQIFFSIDGYGANNARVELVKNNIANSYDLSHNFGNSWSTFSGTHTISSGTATLDIWLFSNFNNQSPGTAFYDNLIIKKICTDPSLPNEDSSVILSTASNAAGLDNKAGAPGNGSATCGIKIENNDESQPWARLRIPIDLVANGISEGDQIFFSIDGYGANNVRVELVKNNTANSYDLSHNFGNSWSTFSGTHTISSGTATLDIWLFSNFNNQSPGTAFYDNLVVRKVGGTALEASLRSKNISIKEHIQTLSVFPNPAINEIQVDIPTSANYTSFSLHSINGALVKKGKINHGQIKLLISFSKMARGIYILKLSNHLGEKAVKKIVKQ